MSMKPWTADEDKQLRELRAEGWSLEQIGQRLHRSRGSIVGRCDRLKLASINSCGAILPAHKAVREAIRTKRDDRLAEYIASDTSTLQRAPQALQLSKDQVRTSWRRIKAQLGWQAT